MWWVRSPSETIVIEINLMRTLGFPAPEGLVCWLAGDFTSSGNGKNNQILIESSLNNNKSVLKQARTCLGINKFNGHGNHFNNL